MTPRRVLWILIVVTAALRLVWAASLGPGNDEAYHYLFTVHPDWSYFDHPPMLAWVEAAGVAAAGGVVSVFSLRLGFVVLFAGSTWLMARLTARLFDDDRAGFLAALALNLTAYHTAAAGTFALPDGPLLFFWLLTLDRLAVALLGHPSNRIWPWVQVGLAWGAALLSKYHAVFLPMGALVYLATDPAARGWLRRPGPYLAAAVGLAVFSPVLVWNARHDWASFVFQGARAVGSGGFRPDALAAALLLPALYLFPWIWVQLVGQLGAASGWGRRLFTAGMPRAERFLLGQAVGPLSTFLLVACTRPVLPHWTLVGFLPLYPLLGRAWQARAAAAPGAFRVRVAVMAVVPMALALVLFWHARTGIFQAGRPGGADLLRVSRDPTVDLYGWDEVAAELKRRGLLDRPGTFLFTSSWYHSGQLGFATRASSTPVLCYHAWDARSFAFWSRPEEWVGRDGILVAVNDRTTEPGRFDPWFTRIEPIGAFQIERGGVVIRKVGLYLCRGQTLAFPFDDLGRSIRPHPRSRPAAEGRIAAELAPGQAPR